jgi:serine/threonine protein kinase
MSFFASLFSQPNPRGPPLRQAVAPRPGEIIPSPRYPNAYQFGPRIGEGSFSVVFCCTDRSRYALAAKVLKPNGTYEAVKAAAEREFGKLEALGHPCVVRVFDAFEYRDTFYLIMERCASSLAEILPRIGRNGLSWVAPVAEGVLTALDYLHSQLYSHQDLHLANVFASIPAQWLGRVDPRTVQFKIGDLGVAKLFHELSPTNTRADWMLPPEARDPQQFGPVDYRVDLYHAGLLLLQVAFGRELRFSAAEILEGVPRACALGLPRSFAFPLEGALRRHVSERTASAMQLLDGLRSANASF